MSYTCINEFLVLHRLSLVVAGQQLTCHMYMYMYIMVPLYKLLRL